MFDKKLIEIFLSKVPDLRNPWKALMTVVYVLFLGILCGAFFYYVDRLMPYAAIISQLVMALVVTIISYVHFKKAGEYREKFGALALLLLPFDDTLFGDVVRMFLPPPVRERDAFTAYVAGNRDGGSSSGGNSSYQYTR